MLPDFKKEEKSARIKGLGFGLCKSRALFLSNRPERCTLALCEDDDTRGEEVDAEVVEVAVGLLTSGKEGLDDMLGR